MSFVVPFFYDLVMTHCPGSLSFVRILMRWDSLSWAILVSVF